MKVAFVDLNFHLEQTKSSQFFIDIVKSNFSDFYLVGANEAWREIPRLKPDTIIFWQAIFSAKEIDSWRAKNIVIIPMFDAVPLTEEFWNEYKKYKIFCFCKKLYDFLTERGFDAFYNQYYIEPSANLRKIQNNDFSLFFWERSKKINWKIVSSLIGNQKAKSIHYHYSTNITNKNSLKPTEDEITKHSIEFSDWFNDMNDYKKIVEQSDIYIAPRESEGIGLSFIEALAFGVVVTSYNAPTMNEYITHGVDGYLFTEENCQELDFSPKKLKEMQTESIKRVQNGYKKWIETLPQVIDFIATPLNNYTPQINLKTYIYKRLRCEIRHIYKKIRH